MYNLYNFFMIRRYKCHAISQTNLFLNLNFTLCWKVYYNIIKKNYCYFTAAGDPNAWRLGRIEETDHETPV